MATTGAVLAIRASYRGSAGPGSIGATLWLALAEQSRRFRRFRRRVLSGRDPEDLHQLRVTVRRLRAVLALGHEALELPEPVQDRPLARLGRALGRLRDADVLQGMLGELVPVAKGEQALALDRMKGRLARRQRAGRRAVRRALSDPELVRVAGGLRRWVRQPRFLPFAFRRLAAAAGGLLAPAEAAVRDHTGWTREPSARGRFSAAEDVVLHDLRKRVKDLRYQLEITTRARPERAARRLGALRELQDRLGQLHDLASLSTAVAAEAQRPDSGSLDWIRRHAAGRAEAATARWLVSRAASYRGIVRTAEGAA